MQEEKVRGVKNDEVRARVILLLVSTTNVFLLHILINVESTKNCRPSLVLSYSDVCKIKCLQQNKYQVICTGRDGSKGVQGIAISIKPFQKCSNII